MSSEAPLVLRLWQDAEPRPGDSVQACGAAVLVTAVWPGPGPGQWIVTAEPTERPLCRG